MTRRHRLTHRSLLLAGSSLLCALGPPALAQTASDDSLEVVIVTAERRETSLQETPVAIEVLSGDSIEKAETRSIEGITTMFAGLQYNAGNRDQARLSLRGNTTNDDSAGTDQGLGYFIDGIYQGRSFLLNQNLPDVERAELLRGPQGTLWGHNITTGSLNITTRDPTTVPEASAKVTLGNYHRQDFTARIAGPVHGEELLGQLSVQSENADGYTHNIQTGHDVNATDVKTVRGKLKWLPNEKFDAELSTGYQINKSFGSGQSLAVADTSPFLTLPTQDQTAGPDGQFDTRLLTASLEMNWALANNLKFSSLTGLIDFKGQNDDFSLLPVPTYLGGVIRDADLANKQYTQEFRLAGDPNARLIWQVGAYFYRADDSKIEDWEEFSSTTSPTAHSGFIGEGTVLNNYIRQDSIANSYALFGQATYALTDVFHITAGGRYSYVEKDNYVENIGDEGPVFLKEPSYIARHKSDWDSFTPKLTLDATFNDIGTFDSLMLYASGAKGWKAGGYNPGTTYAEATTPFQPENVYSYEAGVKTLFLDSRVSLNLTAFRAEYQDLQTLVITVGGAGATVENASVTTDGIEVDGRVKLARWLDLSFGYAYYDAAYDDDAVLQGESVAGNAPVSTPENNLTLGLNAAWDLSTGSAVLADLGYTYRSDFEVDGRNAILAAVPEARKYTKQELLNGRLAYRRDTMEVSIWGRNLLDDVYFYGLGDLAGIFLYPEPGSALGGLRGAPRTYGVSFSWDFK